MEKFLLEIKKTGATIILGYRDGVLVLLDMKETVSKLQVLWVHKSVPHHYAEFEAFKKFLEKRGIKVSEIMPDLSFDNFYNTYNYKKGKKSSVQRTWESMEDTEQAKALAYIKKYNFYLAQHPNVQKKYPQSYLNAQEWNN